MTRAPAKPVAMCCVSIGYRTYLMPADKGMKVVELLQHAIECDERYEGIKGPTYQVLDQPEVAYKAVRPNQIRMRQEDEAVDMPMRRLAHQLPKEPGEL
jgi:hypothetical protein